MFTSCASHDRRREAALPAKSMGEQHLPRTSICHAYCSKPSHLLPVAGQILSPPSGDETQLNCGHQALSYGGSLVMTTLSSTVHDNRLGIAVPLDRLSFAVRPSGAASLLRRR